MWTREFLIIWFSRLKNKGIFKVSLKNHLLLIKRKYHIKISLVDGIFDPKHEIYIVMASSRNIFRGWNCFTVAVWKIFRVTWFCRLENSTKFADKFLKIRQKSAKIIFREDQSSQGKPFWKIWHKRQKLPCSQICGTQPSI